MLLVNKDATANSPVVTPVPPPANEINSNSVPSVKGDNEPMEMMVSTKQTVDIDAKLGAVKTEVLDSSRGKYSLQFCLVTCTQGFRPEAKTQGGTPAFSRCIHTKTKSISC